MEAVARGVSEAHRLGVVHRDLKPANILMAADGTPKVADFGLAKLVDGDSLLTHSGTLIGSPSYMAPEQTGDSAVAVGPASDVHALGAILYELMTGRPPFRGPSVSATLDLVRTVEPVPPSRLVAQVSKDLETICLKCLAKEPSRRYETAGALADDLGRFLDGRGIVAQRAGVLEVAWRSLRRRPTVAALVAALSLSLVGGFVGMAVLLARANHNAEVAREKTELAARDEEQARLASKAETQSRREAERNAALRTLDKGNALAEQGSIGQGLLWMAEAHRLAPDVADDLRRAIDLDAPPGRTSRPDRSRFDPMRRPERSTPSPSPPTAAPP